LRASFDSYDGILVDEPIRIGATSICGWTPRGRPDLAPTWRCAKLAGREKSSADGSLDTFRASAKVGRYIGQLAKRGGFGSAL